MDDQKMKKKTLNVALIGYKFMGKAHSNAYLSAPKFFDLPLNPVMHTLVGRDTKGVSAVADRWGWQHFATDYRQVIKNEEIDLIDVSTTNNSHAEISIASAEAGKAVACEKPLALNVAEARAMVEAVKHNKVPNYVWFNYRRVPALCLAKQLISEGRIGTVYHVRAVYLQDWIMNPDFPLVWRLQKKIAGSGAHGDLNAHIIDMARFLLNTEFDEVCGTAVTFIKERPLEIAGGEIGGMVPGRRKGKVDVDDAVLFLAKFSNGAVGSFESTRFARGHRNGNKIEINGSKGTLIFHFEEMNELWFYDNEVPAKEQGFKRILVTEPQHPYMEGYWPPGHIIGYEHTFINTVKDMVDNIAGKTKSFHANFEDGLRCQEVLDAVLISHNERCWIKISEVK
jgi:predicted dehydrogenase